MCICYGDVFLEIDSKVNNCYPSTRVPCTNHEIVVKYRMVFIMRYYLHW